MDEVTKSFGPTRAILPTSTSGLVSTPNLRHPPLTISVVDIFVGQMRTRSHDPIRMPCFAPPGTEGALERSEALIGAILECSVDRYDQNCEHPPEVIQLRG